MNGGVILDFFTKKESIIVVASIFVIGVLLSIKTFANSRETKLENVEALFSEVSIEKESVSSPKIEKENSLIMVHISGEVYHPGIYELVLGDRVVDAVNMAGG